MKIKVRLICISLLLPLIYIQSQNITLTAPRIVPVTPEAASVEKYASYPVSYATGIPNITVPLYEIKVGDITLPITLTYHSSGLKPKEQSGLVGNGWTLNAQPSIMRNVKGIPDDEPLGDTNEIGYFNNYKENEEAHPGDYLKYVYHERFDEEPDIYSYQLSNGGATCIPDKYGNFKSFPLNNTKISRVSHGFELTDEKGILYKMGGVDQNNSLMGETTGNIITRWLCNEISSATTKAKINFQYSSIYDSYLDDFKMDDFIVIEDSFVNTTRTPFITRKTNGTTEIRAFNSDGTLDNNSQVSFYDTYQLPSRFRSNILHSRYLKEIDFDNGYLKFFTENGVLKSISVYDKADNLLLFIEFYISPFNDNTPFTTKLDSIIISAKGCENRVYRFEYNNPLSVPPLYTKRIDHWGYSNGSYYEHDNETTVPAVNEINLMGFNVNGVEINTIPGRYREPVAEAAMNGMLKKITSPEGVETSFTYEGNQTAGSHYDCPDINECYFSYPIGGLRIKRIEENDPKSGVKHYRYFRYAYYTNNIYFPFIENAGIPKRLVTSDDYCFSQKKTNLNTYSDELGGVPWNGYSLYYSRIRTWGSMPMTEITYNNGSPILYNFVEERKWGTESNDVTSTKYYYSAPILSISYTEDEHSQDDILTDWTATPRNIYAPFESNEYYDFRWGLLKKVENYKNDTIVSDTKYKYIYRSERVMYNEDEDPDFEYNNILPYYFESESFAPDNNWSKVRKVYQTRLCPNCKDPVFKPNVENNVQLPPDLDDIYQSLDWKYTLNTYPVMNESTTLYYNNGDKKLTTESRYQYNDFMKHGYPIKKVTQNSDGTEQIEYFKYVPEQQNDWETVEDLTGTLGEHNIINALLEHKKITNNDTIITRAKYSNVKPGTLKVRMTGNTDFENKLQYLNYDYYGNPVEMADQSGLTTCYIWGYNAQYPIAKIENIAYNDLLTALGKDAGWVETLGGKCQPDEADMTLINNLRNRQGINVYTYTFQPLIGMTSETSPRGVCIHYDRDNLGRLTETYCIDAQGNKNRLQSNSYHLSGATINSMPTDDDGNILAPLIINFAETYENAIYSQPSVFRVQVDGGSGLFQYTWTLWDISSGTEVLLSSTTTSVPYATLTPKPVAGTVKINRLKCKVKDLGTGIEKEIITWFYADVAN